MFKIYYSNFETQVKLVFDLYDFDRDGFISAQDIKIVLSYVPLIKKKQDESTRSPREGTYTQDGGGFNDFEDQVKVQEEIDNMLKICMGDKDKLDLQEFQKVCEETSSDMLVTVLKILKDKLPCTENFYRYQRNYQNKTGDQGTTDGKGKIIASPKIFEKLSPLHEFHTGSHGGDEESKLTYNDVQLEKFKQKKKKGEESKIIDDILDSPSMHAGVIRLANQKKQESSLLQGATNEKKTDQDVFASPTSLLKGSAERQTYCVKCGKETSLGDEKCDNCKEKKSIHFEGEMMRKVKENKLKQYWYHLLEKELYYFKNKDDDKQKGMLNLVGVFLKEEPEEILEKTLTIYPLSLIFPNKTRTFYLKTAEERDKWLTHLKEAVGYSSLFDYYEVKDPLG